MSKRQSDMINKMAPPLYSMNSCFFDCAYMALFGSNDEWINKNFLARNINREFERSFIPSLHLRANYGNSIYHILHKTNTKNMTNADVEMIIDFANTLPQWIDCDFPNNSKLISKNPTTKFVQKALAKIRMADIKYEIQCKRALNYLLCLQ